MAEAASKPMTNDPSMFEARSGKYAPRLLCRNPASKNPFAELDSFYVGWESSSSVHCDMLVERKDKP